MSARYEFPMPESTTQFQPGGSRSRRPQRDRAWQARVVLALAAAAIVCAVASQPVQAQEPQSVNQRAEAERLFRAGEQAYHAGKYRLAAQAFEASYELLPAPQIAFSTAQAYRLQYFVDKDPAQLGRAIELYRVYLNRTPQGGRREVAVTHLAELEPIWLRIEAERAAESADPSAPTAALAPPALAPRRAEVMLTSPVEGAEGEIAGTRGPLPLKVELDAGSYKAKFSADGYFDSERNVEAVAGRFVVIELDLTPVPAKLSVQADTGARVVVNGRQGGTLPLTRPVELAPGRYLVSVQKTGYLPWSEEIEVGRGEAIGLETELRRTRQRKISYGLFGFAGLSMGLAALLSIQAADQFQEAEDIREMSLTGVIRQSDAQRYRDLREDRSQSLSFAYVAFTTASLAGVTGLLLYLFDEPNVGQTEPLGGPSIQPTVNPVIQPDSLGISLSGQF